MAKGPLRKQPDTAPSGMVRKGPMGPIPKRAAMDEANGMKNPAESANSYSKSFNTEQFSAGKMPKESDNRLRMGN